MVWMLLGWLPLVGQPAMERPAMLFTLADLPAMRQRAESGPAAPAFVSLQSRADGHLRVDPASLPDTDAVSGRWIQVVVFELAMTGYLTGEPRYLAQAKALLLASVRQWDVGYYDQRNSHLCVGDAALGLALGYDWLYPQLSEPERAEVRAELEEIGAWLFEQSHHSPFGADERRRKAHNHSAVAHGGLGLIALALGGHEDWLALATDRCGAYLQLAIDATGCGYEGVMYLGYGLHSAILFAEALQRSGGPDLVAESPALASVPDYVLRQVLPWGGGIVQINQTSSLMLPATGLWYLTQRYRDRVGLWGFLKHFHPDPERQFLMLGSPQACTSLPFLFVWGDPELTPQPPAEAGLELSRFFARGQVATRDGWGPDDTLVTLNVGETMSGIWSHGDQNSYTFSSRGESWITDIGPHHYCTEFHNAPLVDGVGQNWTNPGSAVQGSRLEATDRGNSVYVVGDASRAYRHVRLHRRRLLFVRHTQPYLVVLDDLQLDGEPHDASVSLYSAIGHRFEDVDAPTGAARIVADSGASAVLQAFANAPRTIKSEERTAAKFPALEIGWRAVDPLLITVCVALRAGEAAPRIEGQLQGRSGEVTLRFADGSSHRVRIGPDGAELLQGP